MPIISMNLMETLLQNEYTKCNESIPYKTFDHYTVRDSRIDKVLRQYYHFMSKNSRKRAVLSKRLLMGPNTHRMFMSTCLCSRETFSKLHRNEIKKNKVNTMFV